MKTKTLSPELLHKMDAYWRAANYLSVGQIYLYDNPLLKEPLKLSHVKPLVVGHWGTTPGQNFIYVHLNRVIKKYDLDMFYIAGPGHGGPALVGNTYLEGTYSEIYPEHQPGRSRAEEAVHAVLVSRRDFQPRGADDAGVDSRRWRAGVLAQPRLRGRVRQSRSRSSPASSATVKRKRAPWRPPGSPPSFSTPSPTAPCCRSCTSTATRSATRPSWPASSTRNWSSSCAAAAGRPTSWKAMSRKRCIELMAAALDKAIEDIRQHPGQCAEQRTTPPGRAGP